MIGNWKEINYSDYKFSFAESRNGSANKSKAERGLFKKEGRLYSTLPYRSFVTIERLALTKTA